MVSANIYSLENPPEFEFVVNNKGAKDIRCLNYVFRLKTVGKRSWNYLCTSHNCTASLSLKAAFSLEGETKLSEPFRLERLNLKHKDSCQPKLNDHFVSKKFFHQVKTEVKENPLVPIQQLYETQRAESKTEIALPDFINVKDRFKRVRAKDSRPTPTSLSEVIVHDTLTKDGKFNFLIYDNHKKNRILVFVSPIGLKMLSDSDKWHSDGTFHTKSDEADEENDVEPSQT